MMRLLAACVLLAVGGAAGADAPRLGGGDRVTRALAGYVAGKPVDCIDIDRVLGPDVVDATTILYRRNGQHLYRTGPVGACPSLYPQRTLVPVVNGNRLCRGDRFRMLSQGTTISSGYCRFGGFVRYDRAGR